MSMEKSFTDNEIIKALECCIKVRTLDDCRKMRCPALTQQGCSYYLQTDEDYEGIIFVEIIKDAIDLINRQKAEIERLTAMIEAAEEHFAPLPFKNAFDEYIVKVKSEARQEFAERLGELFEPYKTEAAIIWARTTMELLLKEMESESNAE